MLSAMTGWKKVGGREEADKRERMHNSTRREGHVARYIYFETKAGAPNSGVT